jgi:hypothetical protein
MSQQPTLTTIELVPTTNAFVNTTAPIDASTTTTATFSSNELFPAMSAELSAVSHVRLPGFWRHSPRAWFTHAEAVFQNNRVRSDLSRVNHVLGSLDEDGIRNVSDLLGVNSSYETLRSRLINTYDVAPATRLRHIVESGGMGDRTPSQLLRDMREVYPNDMSDKVLEQFWYHKLPPAVLNIVVGLTGSLDTLAERADRIWESFAVNEIAATTTPLETASLQNTAPVVTTSEARFQALESAVLALTTQVAALATSRAAEQRPARFEREPRHAEDHPPRARSLPRAASTTGWCYYHARYGSNARTCRAPCTHGKPKN